MRYAMNRIPWAVALCVLTSGLVGIAVPAKAESQVKGLVRVAEEGVPVANARVFLYDLGGHLAATTQADASGRYSCSKVAPGKYVVVARGPGKRAGLSAKADASAPPEPSSAASVGVSRIEVGVSDADVEENFTLSSSGGVIIGKVTETDGLTPVPNVPVSAYQPLDGTWVATALTWEDGVYFLVVPEGECVLDARRPAGKLYGPVTYDGIEGTISEGDNLALATRVMVNDIVFDKDFRLQQGSITVTSPNGGETWTAGSLATITWTTTAVPPDAQVRVLIRDGADGGGASLNWPVIPLRAGDGQSTLPVPTWLGDDSNYVVELWLMGDFVRVLGSDRSDSPFTITGSSSTRVLEVLSPFAGQPCWTAGTEQTISWTPADLGWLTVVLLDTQGVRGVIGGACASDGTAVYAIPANIGDGNDYRVCLTGTFFGFGVPRPVPVGVTGGTDQGVESANSGPIPAQLQLSGSEAFGPFAVSPEFEICGSAPRPSLNTIQPYPGQNWTAGAFENVCWESDDSTASLVASMLLKNGASIAWGLLWAGPATEGCAGSSLCPYVRDSDDYRVLSILVAANSGLIVTDESDGDFRITGGQELTLKLASFNDGGGYRVGQTYPITWTWGPQDAAGLQVSIELATSTGEIVAYLGNAPVEAGSFDWEICPYLEEAADYLIQLSLYAGSGCPAVWDVSDQPFAITGGQVSTLALTSFNDGGTYQAGQTYTINWDPENADGRMVHVQVFRRENCGGWAWGSYLGEAPAESGEFSWTIWPCIEPASDYMLQITMYDQGCPTVSDDSEMPFEIVGGSGLVAPDFDGDCDVDTDDYQYLEHCASAPGIPQFDPGCMDARLDDDDDVDQADFSVFQRCYSGENVPPTPGCDYCVLAVDAGSDQEACVGAAVQLKANATCGVPPFAYSWTQTAGPPVAIADPTVATVSVTFSEADVYTFVVTVTDAEGTNATDSVSVQVNQCP